MSSVFRFSLEQLTNLGPHPDALADDVKCGGCNWTTSHLYVLAEDENEAIELIRKHPNYGCANCSGFSWEHRHDFPALPDCSGWAAPLSNFGEFAGMCGECFSEFLAEYSYTVTSSSRG